MAVKLLAAMSTLIRAACLTNYVEVAREAGLDPMRQLLDAGLDPSVLREPDLLIPTTRARRLLDDSAQRSGVEAFGLRMARSRQLSNLGPVGMLVRDQPTLRDSIDVLIRYHTAMNGALAMLVEEQGELVLIREELIAQPTEPVRQSIELAVGVLFAMMRQLLGPGWQPRRVCFTHAAPRDMSTHQQFFGRVVEFGHDFNGIVCLARDLSAANPSADPLMARYAQRLLDATPNATTSPEAAAIDDVRRTILLLLPGGRCGIEQVSAHLGLACRTVQRRLADRQLSFSGLVNQLRVQLAQRHVTQGSRPLTDVAALLGFSALSGFSRWYQQQFGCSPSQARAAARAPAPSTSPGQQA
jgi:AraC-like DNA-binding protein